jgi:hypothetical protein
MLINTEEGTPKHINPVPFVERVPSKREAEAAFTRILAALNFTQVETLDEDVETLRRFLWSR